MSAIRLVLFLSALIVCFPAYTQSSSGLEYRNIEAIEGASSFSLKVNVVSAGADDDSDSYSERRSAGSRFDAVSLYNHVRVSPATKFSISAKKNGFLLVGDFKPETDYTVTLKKGLASLEGKQLGKDETSTVRTPSFKPRFTFKSKARYLPGTMQGSLAWEAVNVGVVQFDVKQIYAQNIHQWLSNGEYTNSTVSDTVKSVRVPIKNKKNQLESGSFSLNNLDTLGQGVFVVTAKAPPKKRASGRASTSDDEGGESDEGGYDSYGANYDTATVVVTNLSVIAKRGKQQVKVWVMGTKDLAPAKDARIDLVSVSNKKLDTCTTAGANAECTLAWKNSEQAPYALVVRSGKDLTYVRFEDLSLSNDSFQAGKRDYNAAAGDLDAFVYPERDLYRPGETVNLAAMIRNQKFEVVPKLPLRWTITNPKGKVVKEAVSDTSEWGIARFEFPSTAASETGKYTVAVTSGKKVLHEIGVLIEEFVPERIGLKITPSQEVVVGKPSVGFNITANYLFGPPVAKGQYTVSCSMKPAFSRIPTRADYSTGVYSKTPKQPLTLEAKTGILNEKGVAQAACDAAGVSRLTEAYQVVAKVDVAEAGSGRATTKFGSAYVASSDTLIGLKSMGSKGRVLQIQGGLFDFKGGIKNQKAKVRLQLFNVREHWYYSYGGGGSNWQVEELISPTGVEKSIDVENGAFTTSIETPQDGWGRWLVRAVDAQSGYTADLDAGYIGWWGGESRAADGRRTPEPSALKIEVSKNEVSPGDTISAMITAPFAGRVLFAFETDKTIESRWVAVDKPGQVKVDLQVPNVLPNVYLTALLIKNPTDGPTKRFMPARAWGATSLRVIPQAHRLQVVVAHPEISESRQTVTLALSNDQKIAAEYSVAVVDEGILQMTNYTSPDPQKRFFEPRALGVMSAETMGWTVAMDGGAKNPGGDEARNNASKNMPVKLVSFWFPSVKSDASGKAEIKLPLPAFQGKVRVMAVASAKSRMGSSSTFMTVRDPLVLQSTLPRFLTQGDKFQFPVSITNMSGKDQTVNIEVSPGSLVTLASSKQSLTIPNGQMKTARFDADVKGVSGRAKINVTATSADGKLNSVESFDLPVKPSGIEQTIRMALDTRQEIQLTQYVPGEWRTDHMKIDASISNLPYLNEMSHLEMLIHYPYGCIEQTTSATMPLLAIGDLLKWMDSKPAANANIKDMVNRGISRVLSMQTASGGFAYWPGEGKPDPWGTAYATHMLLDAKKLGYDVPAGALKSSLSYLESWVRQTKYKVVGNNRYDSSYAEPLALYVLAKGGRAITQELRETAKAMTPTSTPAKAGPRYGGLTGENLFLLTAAAKLVGDNESIKLLTDEATFTAQLVGDRDQEHTYWSPMRSDGLRLSVIEDVWPQHQGAEILAERVASSLAQKGNHYYTTQEVAWAVLALGKRLQGMKKVDVATLQKASLVVNGKKVAKSYEMSAGPGFTIEGGNLNNAKVAVADLPAEKGIYLYVKATGYTKAPPKSKSTFNITRRFLNREGAPVNLMDIKQGQTLYVELQIDSSAGETIDNVAIVDRLPAGFEIENPRLGQSEEISWMKSRLETEYQDMRDDRIQSFAKIRAKSSSYIYYSVRAVTKGRYTAPASFIEAMYDPANFDYDQDSPIQIVDAAPAK